MGISLWTGFRHGAVPRGSRPRFVDPAAAGLGDCIDVCDSVMDKMSYPRVLMYGALLLGVTIIFAVTLSLRVVEKTTFHIPR